MKSPLFLLRGAQSIPFHSHQKGRTFDFTHWRVQKARSQLAHPCSDYELLALLIPLQYCAFSRKEARNHASSGQKPRGICSFQGAGDDFRIQATLRAFFLAFLKSARPGIPGLKTTLQIRLIQPTGVVPQGLLTHAGISVPSVLLPSNAGLWLSNLISGFLPCPLS